MSWFDSVFTLIGSIPLAVLPDGVAFWLAMFGVDALIGGIVTGISLSVTISIIKFFGSKLMGLINPLA